MLGHEVPRYGEYADAYDAEEVGALIRGEIVSRSREVVSERYGDVILFRVDAQPSLALHRLQQ